MKFNLVCIYVCLPFLVLADVSSTTSLAVTTEDSTVDLQTLISDFKQIPDLLSQITIFGYEEDKKASKTQMIAIPAVLAAGSQLISIINNGITIGEKLFGSKPVPTANPMIAELEKTTSVICDRLEGIKNSINAGIAKIIERTIQQQFEDQVLNKMAQLEIVTQYYLNGFDKGDQVTLKAQCVQNPPAAVMGALKALLPRMIANANADAASNTDLTPAFKNLLNIVVGVIREFILVYPACVKLLQEDGNGGFGDLNENALNTIKEITDLMNIGFRGIFEDVVNAGGDFALMATSLRDSLKNKYPNMEFGVMVVYEDQKREVERTRGNVFSYVYKGYKGLIAFSTTQPTSPDCLLESIGNCDNVTLEVVVKEFNDYCPKTENYILSYGFLTNYVEGTKYYKRTANSSCESNNNVQAIYSYNGVDEN